MRALLSVHDKQGLVELARGLVQLEFELVATGGTLAALEAAGLPVTELAQVTGFPEILDGRVKTLHPAVHAGLLARADLAAHRAQLAEHGIARFDILVSNLYPFAATLARPEATDDAILEQIDVGGPAMLRAAAKNHRHVVVLVDPADYETTLALLRSGAVDLDVRRRLAATAFAHTAAYDSQVAGYLGGADEPLPDLLTVAMAKVDELRYGENPHQRAALYRQLPTVADNGTLAGARQLHGRALSYVNLLDVDAAIACVRDFAAPAAAILKHTTPCGLATGDNIAEAFRRALATDPLSAFGGAVGVNRRCDLAAAQAIAETHFDDVVAPGFDDDALALLRTKRNLRLVAVGEPPADTRVTARSPSTRLDVRRVAGGFLVQTPDALAEDAVELKVVSRRPPSERELVDLRFAWRAVKWVKSNAIVLARDGALVGIGAGQMSRVDAVELAVRKSNGRAAGAVLASDALIPFADGAEAAGEAGVTAIVQTGGSLRDAEVVAAVDRLGMAMVLTGARHFRH